VGANSYIESETAEQPNSKKLSKVNLLLECSLQGLKLVDVELMAKACQSISYYNFVYFFAQNVPLLRR
jgi:hypothetical protein